MSDIDTERLKTLAGYQEAVGVSTTKAWPLELARLAKEAAAEIERLKGELDEATGEASVWAQTAQSAEAQLARMRGALEMIAAAGYVVSNAETARRALAGEDLNPCAPRRT